MTSNDAYGSRVDINFLSRGISDVFAQAYDVQIDIHLQRPTETIVKMLDKIKPKKLKIAI